MGGFQLAAEFTGIIVGRRKEVAVQPGEIAFDSFLVANAFDEIDPRGVSLVRGARTFDAVQGFDFVNPIVDRRSKVALVRSVCPPPIGPSSRTMTRLPRPANSYAQDKPAIPAPTTQTSVSPLAGGDGCGGGGPIDFHAETVFPSELFIRALIVAHAA